MGSPAPILRAYWTAFSYRTVQCQTGFPYSPLSASTVVSCVGAGLDCESFELSFVMHSVCTFAVLGVKFLLGLRSRVGWLPCLLPCLLWRQPPSVLSHSSR